MYFKLLCMYLLSIEELLNIWLDSRWRLNVLYIWCDEGAADGDKAGMADAEEDEEVPGM